MKERQSNIEALRVIAMTFIVLWHVSIHAQKGELPTHNYIGAITITGVNLFLLITGYFGLKLRWSSFLNIVAIVVFYTALSIVLNTGIFGIKPTLGNIVQVFAPMSFTQYWFVGCYFILMLLSPAINFVAENTNRKQYLYILGILLYLSCISGLLFKNKININGFCAMHFITMYWVGNAIKKFDVKEFLKTKYFIAIYSIATLSIFVTKELNIGTYSYNNPLLIIAATSLFCIVAKQKFTSNGINWLAQFMFPVYLLQDSHFGFNIYKKLYTIGVTESFCSTKYFLVILLYIAALFIGAILLEKTRQAIMNKPVKKLSDFLNKKANIFP